MTANTMSANTMSMLNLIPEYFWLAVMVFAAGVPPLVLAGARVRWRLSRPFLSAWAVLFCICIALTLLDCLRYAELYYHGELPPDFPIGETLYRMLAGRFGRGVLLSAGVVLAVSGVLTLLVWVALILAAKTKSRWSGEAVSRTPPLTRE
jgi:hypothetical protein